MPTACRVLMAGPSSELIHQLRVIPDNPDYRMADVVYHFGRRWRGSLARVNASGRYNNTILQAYLRRAARAADLPVLSHLVVEARERLGMLAPRPTDIVVHLRSGDVDGCRNCPRANVSRMLRALHHALLHGALRTRRAGRRARPRVRRGRAATRRNVAAAPPALPLPPPRRCHTARMPGK